ncbi:MAG: DUF4235 domain-containing protein [Thermoleophilaceae bacterium]
MAKVFFIPFSVAGSLIAGLLGKRLFNALWGAVDEEEPPDPSHRVSPWPKLLAAAALQGAVFAAVRAAADRGSREAFLKLTGAWPGDESPGPR